MNSIYVNGKVRTKHKGKYVLESTIVVWLKHAKKMSTRKNIFLYIEQDPIIHLSIKKTGS